MSFPTGSPLQYPPGQQPPITRIQASRPPTSADKYNVNIGDEWWDDSLDNWYKLVSLSGNLASWILIGGADGPIRSLSPDQGTSVHEDGSGAVAVTGGQVASGTIGANVIDTLGSASTLTVRIQRSAVAALADSTMNGVAHFNNAMFEIDADGFVSLPGGGSTPALRSFTVPTGTSPVVPDVNGVIDIPAGNGFAITGGTNAMTGNMVSPFTGNFTFSASSSGATQSVTIANTSDTASSVAQAIIQVAGASAGNPSTRYSIDGVQDWVAGIDNSDADAYKVSAGSALGTNDGIIIDVNRDVNVPTFLRVGSRSPTLSTIDLSVEKTIDGAGVEIEARNLSNTAGSDAVMGVVVAGTSSGDPYFTWNVGATTSFSMGIRNADADAIYLTDNGTLAGNLIQKWTVDGEITQPLQPLFLAYLPTSVANQTGNGTLYVLGSAGTPLTEVYDQGGNFVTDTFTAPATGKYQFQGAIYVNGCTTASNFIMQLTTTKSNYTVTFNRVGASSDYQGILDTPADMDIGDTATLGIAVSGEGADTVDIVGEATLTGRVGRFSGKLL